MSSASKPNKFPFLQFSSPPPIGIAIHPDRIEVFQPNPAGEPRFCQFDLPEGWIDAESGVVEPVLLGKEIRRRLRDERIHPRKAIVGVAGAIVRQIHLPLPYVPSKEELKVAITTEAERYAMFSEAEAVVDLVAFNQEAPGIRVLFSAIRKDVAQSCQKMMKSAGINLLSIEPLSLACLRPLLSDEESFKEHWGILAWGDQTISISTWRQGNIQIWREIEKSSVEENEDLAAEVLRTVGNDLPEEWRVLSPKKIDGLAERLKAEIDWIDAEKESRIFAVGTALEIREEQNFSLPKFDLRFIEPAKGTVISRKQAILISTAVLYGIGMLSWLFVLNINLSRLQQEFDQTNRRLTLLQNVAAAPTNPQEIARKKGVKEYREGIQLIGKFKRIREIIPGDTWLTRIEMGGEKGFSLDGYALNQRSALSLALSLDREGFGEIAPPQLKREELEGEKIIRFTMSGKSEKGGQE
ncbi:MAG TPA: hypothetical protein DD435_07175 [Cyanobacteria bacterium UBA8530]|nr:hypothetical protein [Cyanobacteria bacterium UBA8530]